MNTQQLLGERVRRIRTDMGLSQEELAFRCRTNAAHIGRIERAENNTTLDVVCRIAEGLQVSVSALLNFDAEPEFPHYDASTEKVIACLQALPQKTRDQILAIVKTFLP